MTKGNNIIFFSMLLAFSAIVGKVSAHPFFVSVAEIRVDTKKSTLNVSCRMFTDDLETALSNIYKQPFDLQNSTDDKNVQQLLDKYIQQRFSIGIGGLLQTLSFVGFEKEDDATWCYLESTNYKQMGSITITNSLLHDFIPDQVNVIHVYVDEVRQSMRLVNPEKVAGFRF